jgi:tRNA(Arg) A34 adenosine deaminase TadA
VARVLDHEALLRRSFDVARRAQTHGNHPFGAILVGPDGGVLIETENGYLPERDMTAHAERLLATQASKSYDITFLATCTLYTSAEPCAMCAGAIHWVGIGRVVFGLSELRLKQITGNHAENPTLDLPCGTVFAAGQRSVEVVGPLLEDEAAALHAGVWNRADKVRVSVRRLFDGDGWGRPFRRDGRLFGARTRRHMRDFAPPRPARRRRRCCRSSVLRFPSKDRRGPDNRWRPAWRCLQAFYCCFNLGENCSTAGPTS